jgi:hypothetical protein
MAKVTVTEKEAKSFRNRMSGQIADDLMKLKQADNFTEASKIGESIRVALVKIEQSYSGQLPDDWLLIPGSQEKLAADIGAEILNDSNKNKPAR